MSVHHTLYQCSQPSGGPARPHGGAAKSPGWDGTAICSPSGAASGRGGGPYRARHVSSWQRGGRWGTVGDGKSDIS